MEPSLLSFIWKYSKRQQLVLLAFTLLTFPFLYVSLELPKRIINDAIGARTDTVAVWGVQMSQVQFLALLSGLFLAAVLTGGLMKMRLNTMRGVLAERMLRRFRYQLISRLMRFPKPYFRTTSQGELVAMITAEAEPMGGLMGDALAQPLFLAGQMITILTFLFAQSFWFGLASVALIPLQAWLIPMLQRQINQLNKERIREIRQFATEIGETAAGISDLRSNGGWRYRLAVISERLGRLFELRFRIYKKKYFMKFLGNFITQLTPFLFYSIGGFLVIRGQISVGALVAALGAYKDLSSPWNELLGYYNQMQDMSLRWQVVTERFAPHGMIDEALFEGEPAEIPHLRDVIEIKEATVLDQDGNVVLSDLSLVIPPRARVAIQSSNPIERQAFASLLVRETLPARGEVILSGHPLRDLHQVVIATRIGYANSSPYLFDGTLGDNLLMPLRLRPVAVARDPDRPDRKAAETLLAGNSPDPLQADWTDPSLAGMGSQAEVMDWWYRLARAMGIDGMAYRRALRSRFDPQQHPDLARRIVAARPAVERRLRDRGLDAFIHRFDPDRFNPAVPLGGNILFAAPTRQISQQSLAEDGRFLKLLEDRDLDREALSIGLAVVDMLRHAFGSDGTDHPLFRRLGIDDEVYHQLIRIADRHRTSGAASLSPRDRALLITVPFLLTAEQIGPGFPEAYKERILELRRTRSAELRDEMKHLFVPVDPATYFPRMTVLENAIFGRVSALAGQKAAEIEDEVAAQLDAAGLRREIAGVVFDLPTGIGGANLPTVLQERAAFIRAAIKRPDILILDKALASHDAGSRQKMRARLKELMPETVMIFMEESFGHPDRYDLFVEIRNGRIDGVTRHDVAGRDDGSLDLRHKTRIIGMAPLFAGLDDRNKRLLAFGAQWYRVGPGQTVFSSNDPPDAVYLCVSGRARLTWPDRDPALAPVRYVEPGQVIGDLSVITRTPRQLSMVTDSDCTFLRIGVEEFRAVLEHDPTVAVKLLETVARHLVGAARLLQQAGIDPSNLPVPADRPVSLETLIGDLDG